MSRGTAILLSLLLLAVPAAVAGGLNPATAKAWEEYVGSARAHMQARLGAATCFLWAEEDASRLRRLHAGEILVVPGEDGTPRHIPGGLIHHWLGAMFIPKATLPEVLSALRAYQQYPAYYPSVVSSRLISRDGPTDYFTSIERHQAMFSKIALDADFTSTYFEPGGKRAYNVATTTRLQQIQDYGGRHPQELGPFAPKAYVWDLATITRYLERDGGVYLELEGMALSRDVPAALRWLVEPFVRQAAQDTMEASLRQSRHAVLGDRGRSPASTNAQAMSLRAR